jgi:hypothetical protein
MSDLPSCPFTSHLPRLNPPASLSSGLDHNQDEDHYHLLLKIHEMRGLTIRSRYETYLSKHGRDYAPTSFMGSTIQHAEEDSTYHIGISQRHGTLREDDTLQTDPSSAPDEFRPARQAPPIPSDDLTASMTQDESTTNDHDLDRLTIAFRTTPLLIDRQAPPPRHSSRSPERPPTSTGRTSRTTIPPAKEQILQAIQRPAVNPIKAKIPLFADVDSDIGSDADIAPGQASPRFSAPVHDGDDELGFSDLDVTPRRQQRVARATLHDSPRSRLRHVHHASTAIGYLSDSPSRHPRPEARQHNGYASDGTLATPHRTRLSVLDEPIPPAGSRFPPMASRLPRSPLSTPRGTSTPIKHTSRLMEEFSSMDEATGLAGEDTDRDSHASVPLTYGGPVRRKPSTPTLPTEASRPDLQTSHHAKPDRSNSRTGYHLGLPDPVVLPQRSRSQSPDPSRHVSHALDMEADQLDRAFAEKGGDMDDLMRGAHTYYVTGILGRAMERWSTRLRHEQVSRPFLPSRVITTPLISFASPLSPV